jgi:hypothetical protein
VGFVNPDGHTLWLEPASLGSLLLHCAHVPPVLVLGSTRVLERMVTGATGRWPAAVSVAAQVAEMGIGTVVTFNDSVSPGGAREFARNSTTRPHASRLGNGSIQDGRPVTHRYSLFPLRKENRFPSSPRRRRSSGKSWHQQAHLR